jgi:signal transduction histidine kinase
MARGKVSIFGAALVALALVPTLVTATGGELAIRIAALAIAVGLAASVRARAAASAAGEQLAREERRITDELAPRPPAPAPAEVVVDTAQRHRETYIAAVSHELRTPLNAILGFTQVLLDDIDGPLSDSQREDVTAIHDAGVHLRALVEEVIGESAGKALARDIGPVEIGPLVRELGRGLEAQMRARPLTLRLAIDPNLPTPMGDARRLRQILWNLGTNAVRYTERGEITIRVVREGDMLRFSVRDTGRGIAKDDLARIFASGERVEGGGQRPVRARPNEGWGLGLAIAQEMAEFHRGHLEVESELGRGSTFHFVMPARGRT